MSNDEGGPNRASLMKRRTALKFTAGSITVSGLSQVAAASSAGDDTVELPIERGLENGEVKLYTKEVPRRWKEYEDRVDNVMWELRDRFRDNSNIRGPSIIKDQSGRAIDGKKVTQLEVFVKEGVNESEIPDSRDGVPITTSIDEPDQKPGACHNTSYSDMKGGVACKIDVDGDGSKDGVIGTTGCRVANPDGNCDQYLLTVNHLFLDDSDGDYDCEGNWDDGLYFHNGNYYGEVYEYNQDMDYAIIDPSNESNINAHIEDSNWNGTVATNKTRSGLKDMMSNDTWVEQMGASTGSTFGEIEGINHSYSYDCIDLQGDGVKTTCEMADGDSGAPMYTDSAILDDHLSMCSLAVA